MTCRDAITRAELLRYGLAASAAGLAGKLDGFESNDLYDFAAAADFKRNTALGLIDKVRSAISRWQDHATIAELDAQLVERISRNFRNMLADGDV